MQFIDVTMINFSKGLALAVATLPVTQAKPHFKADQIPS